MPAPSGPAAIHDLAPITKCTINGAALVLTPQGSSRYGAARFTLAVADAPPDHAAMVTGLRLQGPLPSQQWIELDRFSLPAPDPQAQRLLTTFLSLVPLGGHLMVEYESPEQAESERRLVRGWPPVATPLGWALFQAGAGATLKDWYYSEGGREGPRKLQAFRPLHARRAQESAAAALRQLQAFRPHVPQAERAAYDAVIVAVRRGAESRPE